MSGPPQTPIRYAPNQQFVGRPGTPGQLLGTPQQRPMMQYRPGAMQTPPSQLMMNRGPVGVTPQQAQQLQQQYMQQQQMMRPSPRPAQQQQQQQPFAYTGNTSMAVAGVGLSGQQAHPALVQRKRKGGKAGDDEGDELDNIQPYSISLARYQNNHNLMAEIFVALPSSTIEVPDHYYAGEDRGQLEQTLAQLDREIEESARAHGAKAEQAQRTRDEFSDMVRALREQSADKVRQLADEQFGMQFVDNPYRTVERVAVQNIEMVENPQYKQL
ncbi:hypothetical protein IWW55_001177 [Coemansia sp. RSA 2706]|nr:hypothetical protein LPJ63_003165 [Coemansia sp. RSA 2711]KAJ2307012.1 hypothetical protein IWW55_001177 [Coemansia sp. RSA 2706]KAJ2312919.1 hypothetical protein IWW54_001808 [Coemansia sp. RSA 2705]KAJ2317186.1 hypothetical protein IWW52_003260 [Coemansia sp. RSA 2704]KAJ2328704.1 hypothetical protein IWW51_001041 [Coemansia sp. RSA 2702]KAJ2368362.1 hypothetical protein H4S01_001638 [Coemansia sp. RSA 2610]KAJ2384311.1 hypothetical protein H4S02_004872 [Coemansia sp. RSA 2611]KAJ273193